MRRTQLQRAALAGLGGIAVLLTGCGSTTATAAPSPAATRSVGGTASASSAVVATAATAARETNPAGDIPDNQAYVPFTSPAGYTLKTPEGWARSDSAAGPVFTDKYNSIAVQVVSAKSPPTVTSVKAEMNAVSRSSSNFVMGKVTTVTRKGGTAVLSTYRADSAQNPVTGKVTAAAFERYAFWHNGSEVVLTLGGPVGADNVDPWKIVTDSFSFTR